MRACTLGLRVRVCVCVRPLARLPRAERQCVAIEQRVGEVEELGHQLLVIVRGVIVSRGIVTKALEPYCSR